MQSLHGRGIFGASSTVAFSQRQMEEKLIYWNVTQHRGPISRTTNDCRRCC